MADLREFDEYADLNVNVEELSLYQSALRHFEENGIPHRFVFYHNLPILTNLIFRSYLKF